MTTRVLHNYSICCLSSLSTSLWTLNDSLRSSSWLSGSCSSESPDSCNLSRLQSIPNLAEKYKIWKKCNLYYFKRRCYLGNFTLYAITKKSIKWRGSWFRDFNSNNTIAILGQKSTYIFSSHFFPQRSGIPGGVKNFFENKYSCTIFRHACTIFSLN